MKESRFDRLRNTTLAAFAVILLAGGARPGAAGTTRPALPTTNPPALFEPRAFAAAFGIDVQSIRLTAAGRMLDLRYRILDAPKAKHLMMGRRNKPQLIDETSGVTLATPSFPKVGTLSQARSTLYEGRIYFALFAIPPGLTVGPGDALTLAWSDARVPGLIVQ